MQISTLKISHTYTYSLHKHTVSIHYIHITHIHIPTYALVIPMHTYKLVILKHTTIPFSQCLSTIYVSRLSQIKYYVSEFTDTHTWDFHIIQLQHIHTHTEVIHIPTITPPFLWSPSAPIFPRSILCRYSLPSVVALTVVSPSSSRLKFSLPCRPSMTGRW